MKKTINAVMVLILYCINVNAQNFNQYYKEGMYQFDDDFKLLKSDVFSQYGSYFGFSQNNTMVLKEEGAMDQDGGVSGAYQQYCNGYPVEHVCMNVISNYGVVLFVNGFSLPTLNVNVQNPISEDSALSVALQAIGAPKYTWQDSLLESSAKLSYDSETGEEIYDSSATLYPKGKLLIARPWKDTAYTDTSTYRLCYKFFITPMYWNDSVLVDTSGIDSIASYDTIAQYVPDRTLIVYVNAINGQLYTIDSNIHGAGFWVNCTVNSTSYDGNQTVQARKVTLNAKRWGQDSRNINLRLYNGDLFYVKDDIWSGEHYKSGASSYWCLEKSWDYFHDVHGFEGPHVRNNQTIYFNWSTPFSSYGLADDDPIGYQQETDEIDKYLVMIDDDNNGSQKSIAHLDILGHEYTHAMIQHKPGSNAFINTGDAASICEGFCDYFGMCAAIWGHSSRFYSDWTNGWAQYSLYPYPRHFNDPTSDFLPSSDIYPPTSPGTYYFDPYILAGLFRKFFYLVEFGGTNHGTTVTAINSLSSPAPAPTWDANRNAFITMYWWCWSNMNYIDLRNSFTGVYKYYYKPCSPKSNEMYRAWQAVGIGPIPLCGRTWVDWTRVVGTVVKGQNNIIYSNDPTRPRPAITVRPTDGIQQSDIVSYEWILPQQWYTHFSDSQEHSEIIIDSVTDLQSRYFTYIVHFADSTADTVSKPVHFINSENYQQRNSSIFQNEKSIDVANPDVLIYPNPASNYLNVSLPFEPSGRVLLEIFDITGRQMLSRQISRKDNIIYLSSIPQGTYLVKVRGEQFDCVKRIIFNGQ